MVNNETSPTIEQSLKMIEEKLKSEKKNKENAKNISSKVIKNSSISSLFKKDKKNEEKKVKKRKKEDVLLLTNKINEKDKVLKNKVKPKINKVPEKKVEEEIDLNIKNSRNLSKTTELAVIIKKLKNMRDKKLNNKKKSKKINKEIRKLNETIDLAEDLFKKELLDL